MNDLWIIAGLVVATELGLILTFLKVGRLVLRLINTLLLIHQDFDDAKKELTEIKTDIGYIKKQFDKLREDSIVQIKGMTPLGNVDAEIELSRRVIKVV